jgi:hypothetical protein
MRGEEQEYEKLNIYEETRIVTWVAILYEPEVRAVTSKGDTTTDGLDDDGRYCEVVVSGGARLY